jgi:hypothetical protein
MYGKRLDEYVAIFVSPLDLRIKERKAFSLPFTEESGVEKLYQRTKI